jgi:tetratricopeptide (TPR) repeat protein
MRLFLLSLLLPGAGQILSGHVYRGMALCAIYVFFASMAFTRSILPGSDILLAIGMLGAGGSWLAAQMGMLSRLKISPLQNCVLPMRDDYFQRGVTLYFQAEMERSEHEFRRALRLDPTDTDAWFYLAASLYRQGKIHRAARAFGRCAELDVNGKWEWHRKTLFPAPAKNPDRTAAGNVTHLRANDCFPFRANSDQRQNPIRSHRPDARYVRAAGHRQFRPPYRAVRAVSERPAIL